MNRVAEAAQEFEGLRLGVRRRGDIMTGNLEISKVDPELRLTDTGNSEYTRLTRSDTSNKAILCNRVSVPSGTSYQMLFDGTDDWIDVGTGLNATQHSLEFWIKTTDAGLYKGIVDKEDVDGYNGWGIWISEGKFFYYIWNNLYGSTSVLTQLTYNNNAWHHVVATNDGTTNGIKIYVDGDEVSTDWYGANPGIIPQTSRNVIIGARGYAYPTMNSLLAGTLDEVRIYSIVLSQTQITSHYNSANGLYQTDTTNMLGGYSFDEGSGTSVADYSGNGNNGTTSGSPTWQAGEKANPTTSVQEVEIIKSIDGNAANEKGIHYLGAQSGTTYLRGTTIQMETPTISNSTGVININYYSTGSPINNGGWLSFKTGNGSTIYMPYWY